MFIPVHPQDEFRRVDRRTRLHALRHHPEEVRAKFRRIHDAVLSCSSFIRTVNFTSLSIFDLQMLYELYDREYFDTLLRRSIDEDGAAIQFRLSSRMTRTAGTTTQFHPVASTANRSARPTTYEIAVSTTLLYNTFREASREVTIGGLVVQNRLEALQRIIEHELLHLAEFLGWGRSSCSERNFHQLSQEIFGHAGAKHDLITPRELAAVQHGIRVGDQVSFEFEGVRRIGRVNRITKRATVLVDDPKGRLYSNGGRYATFYVPIPWLTKVEVPRQ